MKSIVAVGLFSAAMIGIGTTAALADSTPTYANCTEVAAAGKAPIYPGQPGFQPKFDRDHDGIGCETRDNVSSSDASPTTSHTITPLPAQIFGSPSDTRYVHGK